MGDCYTRFGAARPFRATVSTLWIAGRPSAGNDQPTGKRRLLPVR